MRETEKVITVNRTIQEDVTLTKEEITSYTVNKRDKTITVEVRLFSDEATIVERETHRFFSDNFVDNPTENDLWELIDSKRSDV